MLPGSVVLLSSGLDSSVNLAKACETSEVYLALTFDYGQRARDREIFFAKKLASHYNVAHRVVCLPWLSDISASALNDENAKVPSPDINSDSETKKSAKAVWVSNRNGLFVNIAGCFAESMNAAEIVVGFNKEEATTFPDNSMDFITALNGSLSYSTLNKVKVKTYTGEMNKKEIVEEGRRLGVPFSYIWPCYEAGEELCGKCESCKRFFAAGGSR